MPAPSTPALVGRDRFRALWQRNLVAGATDDSASIHQRLRAAYREPQRFYHTLHHIEHCLSMFEDCRLLIRRPDNVELAIWFHDAVYEPGNADNEARSAVLYQELAGEAHADKTIHQVKSMIMATLHDGKSLELEDAGYLVDIDLSGFGLPWEEFLRDSQDLRRESPQVNDADFYRGQGAFQANLLARERFYVTEYFYQRFETRARANLARYFKLLEQKS